MTERQVKIRMTKLNKLVDELELLKDSKENNTAYADSLKEKIKKIQKELIEADTLPTFPVYLYDVESGDYKPFPER